MKTGFAGLFQFGVPAEFGLLLSGQDVGYVGFVQLRGGTDNFQCSAVPLNKGVEHLCFAHHPVGFGQEVGPLPDCLPAVFDGGREVLAV